MIEDNFNKISYLKNNPSLGYEDVEYKFFYIKSLLDDLCIKKSQISILDVGGGGGFLGRKIVEYFIQKGYKINFAVLDVSKKMIKIQKKNNPFITSAYNCYIDDLQIKEKFDLVLMIDVIEHIVFHNKASKKISEVSNYVLYNIPIEINLFDLGKNILMRNKYYKMQRESLGHLHFFSYFRAKRHFKKFFRIIDYKFPNYAEHILYSKTKAFDNQRNNKFRKFELILSNFIYKYFKIVSPLIIQGSLFILGKTKKE